MQQIRNSNTTCQQVKQLLDQCEVGPHHQELKHPDPLGSTLGLLKETYESGTNRDLKTASEEKSIGKSIKGHIPLAKRQPSSISVQFGEISLADQLIPLFGYGFLCQMTEWPNLHGSLSHVREEFPDKTGPSSRDQSHSSSIHLYCWMQDRVIMDRRGAVFEISSRYHGLWETVEVEQWGGLILHQGEVVSSRAMLKSTMRFHRAHAEIKNSAGKINSRHSQGN